MRNNNDIYDKEWAQTEWRDKPWVNEWADEDKNIEGKDGRNEYGWTSSKAC